MEDGFDAELQSLREAGAIHEVKHAPRGAVVLPMKSVLTLKPKPGSLSKRRKARACACGNFQDKEAPYLV